VGESGSSEFVPTPAAAFTELGNWTGLTLKEGSTLSFEMSYDGATHLIEIKGTAGGLDLSTPALMRDALEAAINDANTFTSGFTVSVNGDALTLVGPVPTGAGDAGRSISIAGLRADVE